MPFDLTAEDEEEKPSRRERLSASTKTRMGNWMKPSAR